MRLLFLNKDFFKNILLILFGLFLAFIITEGYLRIFDNPFGFRIRGDKIVLPIHRQYNIHNTEIQKLDEYIIHKKNSLGFRGDEPPDKFQDYLTIVTIGGSTTECFYLSEGQTWADILGVNLEKNFEKMWINNAGLDGTSTFGHIVLMEDYMVTLKPKIALFLVGINDVSRSELNRYDKGILKTASEPTDVLKNFALAYSEVAVLGYNVLWYIRTWDRQLGHSNVDFENLAQLEISPQKAVQAKELYQGTQLDAYRIRLETLIQIARTNGMEPVLVTQPAVYGNAIDPTTGIDLAKIKMGNLNGELRWEILELYNAVTKQVGRDNQILVIDLANKLPKDTKYFYDYLHYTQEGAEAIADVIYQDLCPFLEKEYNEYLVAACIEK